MGITYRTSSYCCPERDGNEYFGWHERALKCFTQEVAERLASKYGKKAFYCEYGDCWHLGG